ncbi:hypothetical protein IJ579_03450 [bacterium]|nr:hypothetical protein [bacterium]
MGLAASQARLLSLTSRMADNELRSQTINNAKMRLAAESSAASETYLNALNNANIMFSSYGEDGTPMTQLLTYNSLTNYSSYNTQYGLVNSGGQILVAEDEANMFIQANGNLSDYLAAHGLTFDTTYFDPDINGQTVEVDGLANYPAEFQADAKTLKTWYESYDAYANSIEMDNYRTYTRDFISKSTSYMKVIDEIVKDLIQIKTDNITGLMGTASKSNSYANTVKLKEDLTNITNDVYKMVSGNFLEPYETTYVDYYSGETKDFIADGQAVADIYYQNIIDNINTISTIEVDGYPTTNNWNEFMIIKGSQAYSYQNSEGHTIHTYLIGWNSTTRFASSKITDENGNSLWKPSMGSGNHVGDAIVFEEYTEDGVEYCEVYTSHETTHDKNNPVIYKASDEKKTIKNEETGKLETVTIHHSAYENAMNKLFDSGIRTSNDSHLIITEDGSIAIYNKPNSDIEEVEKYVTSVASNLQTMMDLLKNSAYFNKLGFSESVLEDCLNGTNTFGINYSSTNTNNENINQLYAKTGITLEEYIKDFVESAITYFGFIEGVKYDETNPTDLDILKSFELYNLIRQNTDSEADYTDYIDLDNLLQVINENDVTYTKEFRNIVRASILDKMIDVYGEPKYTWIDENDNTNTGNASAKAQWYTNLFDRMSKGYKVLENGLASSAEWLEFALETGIVTMEQVDKTFAWRSLDYKCCTGITEETNSDAAVAKAEAEYNRTMKEIEAKDRVFDLELKNIDSEHQALEAEYSSVKSALSKNIERTMKLDQNS